jgi:diacylglycerol kinase
MIDPLKFARSVGFAAQGLLTLVRSENNARIHALAVLVVVGAGWYVGLTAHDWLWVALAITLVLTTEAVNTALEKLVDLVSPERRPLAGQVKDLAAGAVLLTALFALVVAGVVFAPYLLAD